MNWGEIIGAATGVSVVSGFIIKFLVSDWFKKAKEIEKLKASQMANLLDRFERDINSLGTKMRSFETRINDFEKKQIGVNAHVDSVTRLFENALDSARRVSDGLDKKVNDAVRTEVLKLKDDLIMIRKRQTTNGK